MSKKVKNESATEVKEKKKKAKNKWNAIVKRWNRIYGKVNLKIQPLQDKKGGKVFRSRYLYAVHYAVLHFTKGFDIFRYNNLTRNLSSVQKGNSINSGNESIEEIEQIEKLERLQFN